MNVDQLVGMACLGITTALLKGEIRLQEWVTVGEMLLEHPRILREIREWVCRVGLADLKEPGMQAEVRKRGETAQQIAEFGARGFIHRMLFPLTITDLISQVRTALTDREVITARYPFTFGAPVNAEKAEEAARLTGQLLERASRTPLPWERR